MSLAIISWHGGVTVSDVGLTVVSSTPGRVAVKWLLPGWVTVYGLVNHLGIWPRSTQPSTSIPPG